MKVLRHIGGIVVATFGTCLVLGALIHVVEPDPELENWVAALLGVIGLFALTVALVMLRATVGAPSRQCPKCGGIEKRAVFALGARRSRWLYHFTGWLLASLWGASREQEVQCAQCSAVFQTHTKATRIVGVVLWVFVLILALGIVAEQLQPQ